MRIFELHRDADATGISGIGVVAQGVEFEDGSVALRWGGEWPTSVVFHDEGIQSVLRIHGHDGATRVVWLGYDQEPLADAPMPAENTNRGFSVWLSNLEDINGQRLDVLNSSLATESAVRVYVKGDHIDQPSACAHLNARQAVALRDALNTWLLWLGDAAATNPPAGEASS